MTNFPIRNRLIGDGCPPYLIAEISGNHNGDLKLARELIQAASESGADAIKLQTYTPDTLTLKSNKSDFKIDSGLWAGQTLWDLYDKAHTPWEWHSDLFDLATSLGVTIFSSPFDKTAVDFLVGLGVNALKVASFEANDPDFLRYVVGTKLPTIISTGMLNVDDVDRITTILDHYDHHQSVVLHCISGYPAPAEDYNLYTLVDLKRRTGRLVGLSDHTIGNTTALASVALGACVIEKHFTLDRNGGGPDDTFSSTPAEFKELATSVSEVYKSLGRVEYGLKDSEKPNVKFQRSLYFLRDMKKGDVVGPGDVRSVRPGYGEPPHRLNEVIGRVLTSDVEAADPVLFTKLT